MKRQNNLDNFFIPLSRIILVIPIFAIIIALFFRTTGKLTLTSKQTIPSPIPTIMVPTPTPEIKIDLQGPYMCAKTDGASKVTVNIKNKQIYAQIMRDNTSDYVLLKGDCLYRWQGYRGDKTCGISQFMTLYDTMSAFGAVNAKTIMDAIASSGFASASDEAMLGDVMQTCQKQEVAESIFVVPTNVTFKDSQLLKDMKPLTQ